MPSMNYGSHKEEEEFVPSERRTDERTFQELLAQLSLQHDWEVLIAADNAREDSKACNGFCKCGVKKGETTSALKRTLTIEDDRLQKANLSDDVFPSADSTTSTGQRVSSELQPPSKMSCISKASIAPRMTVNSMAPRAIADPSKKQSQVKRNQSVTISEGGWTVKSAATSAIKSANTQTERERISLPDRDRESKISKLSWVRGAFSTRTQSPQWFSEDEDDQFKHSLSLPVNPMSHLPMSGPQLGGFQKPKMQRWREVVADLRQSASTRKMFVAEPISTNLFGYVRKSVASKTSSKVKKPVSKASRGTTTSSMSTMRDVLFVDGRLSAISRDGSVMQEPLFELHDIWNESSNRGLKSKKLRKVDFGRDSRLNPSDSNLTNQHRFVLKPQGYPLLLWTCLGFISITYDFLTVPMLVFPVPETDFTTAMDRYSLVFWSIDLCVKFRTGFYTSDGASETDPRRIAANYFHTWFIIDVALLVLEWLQFIFFKEEGSASGSTGRVVRGVRFFRMARLIRLVRMKTHMVLVRDYLCSELAVARFTIAKTVVAILAINHFIACIWFAIGEHWAQPGWTALLENCEFWCQYTTALHWSVVQFGVGDSNIMPRSDGERTFNIIVLLFALVAFSSVVSSITQAMSQLGTIRHDQVMQFAMFHRFCRENHISKSLTRRVQRHLEYAYDQRARQIPIKEVALFDLLSGPLKDEVLFNVWQPHVARHPLFARLCRRDINVMHMVSRTALNDVQLAPSDVLFSFGQVAEHMYFLAKGGFEYLSAYGHGHSTTSLWLCEAALWCPWCHVGEIKGHTECKFVALNAQEFGIVVGMYPSTFMRVRRYALQYIENLNLQSLDELTDVDEGLLVEGIHLSSTGEHAPTYPANTMWYWWNYLRGRDPDLMMAKSTSEQEGNSPRHRINNTFP